MFNFLLDRAGEFMARIVSAILSAVISVLRSIAVKLMIWIFNLFDVSGRAGFGLGDDAVQLNNNVVPFYRMFGSDGGLGESILGKFAVDVLLPVSIAIVVLMFSWSLFKSIVSDKAEESPGKIIIRVVITFTCVVLVYRLMGLLFNVALSVQGIIYRYFARVLHAEELTITEDHFGVILELFSTLIDVGADDTYQPYYYPIISLVSIIFPIILAIKYAKLIFEYFSRYVRLELVRIFAPLGISTAAMNSTEDICKAYLRLYVSCLGSVLFSYALILVARFACVTAMTSSTTGEIFLWFCLALGIFHFIDNLDAYLDKAGLNNLRRSPSTLLDGLGFAAGQALGREVSRLPRVFNNKLTERFLPDPKQGGPVGGKQVEYAMGSQASHKEAPKKRRRKQDFRSISPDSPEAKVWEKGDLGYEDPAMEQYQKNIKGAEYRATAKTRVEISGTDAHGNVATIRKTKKGNWAVKYTLHPGTVDEVSVTAGTFKSSDSAIERMYRDGYGEKSVIVRTREEGQSATEKVEIDTSSEQNRYFTEVKKKNFTGTKNLTGSYFIKKAVNDYTKVSGTMVNGDGITLRFEKGLNGAVKVFHPKHPARAHEYSTMEQAVNQNKSTEVHFDNIQEDIKLQQNVLKNKGSRMRDRFFKGEKGESEKNIKNYKKDLFERK